MIRIGIDSPDTSHVRVCTEAFADGRDFEITAIYPGESIRSRSIIEAFASEHDIAICDDNEAFLLQIDAVLLLGVNWNTHIDQAESYLASGKSIYIDKPVCGSFTDLVRLRELIEKYPGKVFGGSALPHTRQFSDFLDSFLFFAKSGDAEVEIYARLDSYFMATHSFELASLLLTGTAAIGVTWTDQIEIKAVYHSFTRTILLKQAPTYEEHPWTIHARIGEQILHCPIPLTRIYDGLLDAIAEHFESGSMWSPGISLELALAAERSGKSGKQVMIADLGLGDQIPSTDFVSDYRARHADQPL